MAYSRFKKPPPGYQRDQTTGRVLSPGGVKQNPMIGDVQQIGQDMQQYVGLASPSSWIPAPGPQPLLSQGGTPGQSPGGAMPMQSAGAPIPYPAGGPPVGPGAPQNFNPAPQGQQRDPTTGRLSINGVKQNPPVGDIQMIGGVPHQYTGNPTMPWTPLK